MFGPLIGVIGAGSCSGDVEDLAVEVGRAIALAGGALVCGGLGGVMEGAARGAKEAGGWTIGILPGPDTEMANAFIDFPIATNVGHARNVIIVHTAMVLIAVSGGYGTLSEIALALKAGKRVVALRPRFSIQGVETASSAREAVDLAFALINHPLPDR
jgi:uncharacterized protein (TIGR00725 family)